MKRIIDNHNMFSLTKLSQQNLNQPFQSPRYHQPLHEPRLNRPLKVMPRPHQRTCIGSLATLPILVLAIVADSIGASRLTNSLIQVATLAILFHVHCTCDYRHPLSNRLHRENDKIFADCRRLSRKGEHTRAIFESGTMAD